MSHNLSPRKQQNGFTIIELAITLMVISILMAPFAYQQVQKFQEDMIEIASAEINDVFQSAQNYASENSQWPSESDNCASAISTMESQGFLQGFSLRSAFGTNIVTSCTTGAGKRFMVTVNAVDSGRAELLKGYLPSSTVSGSIVTVSVPLPAVIPALEHLLPRDGSRPMTGNLQMDNNNIVGANQIEAETVLLNSIVTKGNSCSRNGVVARDSSGRVLSCVSGQWQGAEGTPSRMVAFFNDTSCPDGWRVSNGSGGTRDIRGEFIRGLDVGRGLDSGRTLGSTQLDQMQRITASVNFGGIEGSGGIVTSTSGAFSSRSNAGHPARGGSFAGSYARTLDFDSAGQTRAGSETRPRNVALLGCQKD